MHGILETFKEMAIMLWVAMPNPYQSNINSQDSMNSSTKGLSVVTHMDPRLNPTCILCHKFPNQCWVPILLPLVIHQHLIHWNKISTFRNGIWGHLKRLDESEIHFPKGKKWHSMGTCNWHNFIRKAMTFSYNNG
jgi:hypothetical protein